MLDKTIRYIIIIQTISLIGLLGCIILRPHGLVADAGLSYFGNYKATILPYALILLGGSYYFYRAAGSLPPKGYLLSKIAFYFFSVLYIGVFITPYTLNNWVDWTHSVLGVALFTSELVLTAWITFKSGFNTFLSFVWVVEFLAGVICAVYTPTPTGYLLESQVVFQIAFTIFYVKYLQMDKKTHKYTETKAVPYFMHNGR